MEQIQISDSGPMVLQEWGPAGTDIRRLLVLLPDSEFREAALARAVWTIAARNDAPLRFLSAVDDWSDEPRIRMRVALLMAMLRESGIESEVEFVRGSDWMKVILDRWAPGDVVVSLAELSVTSGGALSRARIPLSQALAALGKPNFALSGIAIAPERGSGRSLMSWLLPALVIVGAFVAQAVFLRLAREWALWARQAAFIASSALEVALIALLSRPRPAR